LQYSQRGYGLSPKLGCHQYQQA